VRSLPPALGDVFELRVSLRHIEPPIWRTLRVPADVPLGILHEVLQAAFGWQNSHLHDFLVGDIRFGMTDVDDEVFSVDERGAPLGAVARAGSTWVYRYDFGDDWEHAVVVEHVGHDGDQTIRCTGGARACPPEDCGGPPGYAHMLEVLANPEDEEHSEMKQWVPRGFTAEKFDVVAVNKKLVALSKRVARWATKPMRRGSAPARRP
jgi:Plasmid pRiA4b ORF-3-like protein